MPPSPSTKRQKLAAPEAVQFNQSHIDNLEVLKTTYLSELPFPHILLPNAISQPAQILNEVISNLKVTYKESDLFKFYQSVDLANISDISSSSSTSSSTPTLLSLINLLYSSKFTSYIESLLSLPPSTLTSTVDMAANVHTSGCHLLAHDDCISTRCVSYILYFSDSDWDCLVDGGGLELYDVNSVKKERDLVRPCKVINPTFGSMAMFRVNGGETVHSIQEVTREGGVRMAIQGWYHQKEPAQGMEAATLGELKGGGKEVAVEGGGFVPFSIANDDADDVNDDVLKKYINPTYLTPASMEQIAQRFETDSSVQLREFLNEETMKLVDFATGEIDSGGGESGYDEGIGNGWSAVGPVHKQRYLELTTDTTTSTTTTTTTTATTTTAQTIILSKLKTDLFSSPKFKSYLAKITSLPPSTILGRRGQIRRFRKGLDYTVAYHGQGTGKDTKMLDATVCFVKGGSGKQVLHSDENEEEQHNALDEVWESGEVGGFECYTAEDEEEDEEHTTFGDYNNEEENEDNSELLSVRAGNNMLNLVLRDEGTLRFVKFVNHEAPGSRFDVCMEYEVEEACNDDDEDDE